MYVRRENCFRGISSLIIRLYIAKWDNGHTEVSRIIFIIIVELTLKAIFNAIRIVLDNKVFC